MKEKKKIGRYTIEEELGRGAMGIVYKGIDDDLERPIAAKMLPKLCFSDESQIERFRQEAKIIAKLDHPNIMKIYSIEYAEDTIWIIMEYLQGKLLSDLIKEKIRFSTQETIEILEQMAKALGYAHSKGIIHRDIKPVNVMISPKNTVKLMDFGIARDNQSDVHLTRTGTILGTPRYMSPEQFKGKGIDYRSDIYSLGILGYEMLSGDVPFIGKNIMDFAYKHLNEQAEPIRKKVPSIPSSLETFIHQCLQKQIEKRPNDLLKIRFSDFDAETLMVNSPIKSIKKNRVGIKFILFILIIIIILFFYFFKNELKSFIHNFNEKTKPVIINNALKTQEFSLPKIVETPEIKKEQAKNNTIESFVKEIETQPQQQKYFDIKVADVERKENIVSEENLTAKELPIYHSDEEKFKEQPSPSIEESIFEKDLNALSLKDTYKIESSIPENIEDKIIEEEQTLIPIKEPSEAIVKIEAISPVDEFEEKKDSAAIYNEDNAIDETSFVLEEELPDIYESIEEEKNINELNKESKNISEDIVTNDSTLFLNQLKSTNYKEIRTAVVNIIHANCYTDEIISELKNIIINYSVNPDTSKISIDAISWCLKAIGQTNETSFLPIIEELIKKNIHSKINKHALNSCEKLLKNNSLGKNTKIILSLQSKDYAIIRNTLKTIMKTENFDVEVLDEIKNVIESYLAKPDKGRNSVDAISLCIVALGQSKNLNYRNVIEKVNSTKVHRKIKSHAMKALKALSK